jgi:hypothetical protein
MLWDACQIRAFRKKLANQAIGILVRAALPGAVRFGKICFVSTDMAQNVA